LLVINNQLLLLKLPLLFIYWWFVTAPIQLLVFFFRYLTHLSQVLSLPLLVKTFFVPWKNENKKGYVAIARGIGMTVKTSVILADLMILIIFFMVEVSLFLLWMLLPILSIYLLITSLIK
jgi:hypothetical protein